MNIGKGTLAGALVAGAVTMGVVGMADSAKDQIEAHNNQLYEQMDRMGYSTEETAPNVENAYSVTKDENGNTVVQLNAQVQEEIEKSPFDMAVDKFMEDYENASAAEKADLVQEAYVGEYAEAIHKASEEELSNLVQNIKEPEVLQAVLESENLTQDIANDIFQVVQEGVIEETMDRAEAGNVLNFILNADEAAPETKAMAEGFGDEYGLFEAASESNQLSEDFVETGSQTQNTENSAEVSEDFVQ